MDSSNLLANEENLPAWATPKEPEIYTTTTAPVKPKKVSNMPSKIGVMGVVSMTTLFVLWVGSFALFGVNSMSVYEQNSFEQRFGLFQFSEKTRSGKIQNKETYSKLGNGYFCTDDKYTRAFCDAQEAAFGADIGVAIAIMLTLVIDFASIKYASQFMATFSAVLTFMILVGYSAILFGWTVCHVNLNKRFKLNNQDGTLKLGAGFYIAMIGFFLATGLFVLKICIFCRSSSANYEKQSNEVM